MLAKWQQIAVGVLFFISSHISVAGTYALSLRGNEENLHRYLTEHQGIVLLNSDTKEFVNGNTFVRFEEQVTGQDVVILLPETMTPNLLMEALIKTRTAQHQRANKIRILMPEKFSQNLTLFGLDYLELFSIAGASHFEIGENWHGSLNNAPIILSRLEKSKAFIRGEQHPELAAELGKLLNIPTQVPDNSSLDGALVFYIMSATQPVNEQLFKGLGEIKRMSREGAGVILITPYLPYARSDKIDQKGVSITGRLVADLIEGVGTDSIVFVRAHAAQSEGFFKIPTLQVSSRSTINDFIRSQNIDVLISPDHGAEKDANLHADELGLPIASLNKVRNPLTSKVEIRGISDDMDVKGKRVVIIDDETASGGTFAEAAQFLKQKGAASIIGIVTHLAGDAQKAISSTSIEKVSVTNTIPIPNSAAASVVKLSIAPELAHALIPFLRITNSGCSQPFLSD